MKTIFKLLFTGTLIPVLAMLPMHSICLHAQSLEPFNPYGIFSPSVEAWQMTRYGNLSPSLYTGAMTFSLPLYTYEDPDFTIPISLEYSFDGYRPGQHSGTVGYGWYLNCGGVITREVRGVPDEGVSPLDESYQVPMYGWLKACADNMTGLYNVNNVWSAHRYRYDSMSSVEYVSGFMTCGVLSDTPAYMSGVSDNWTLYDMQPDLWHFSFLGHSGDFVITEDGTVRVYNTDLPDGQVSIVINVQDRTPSSMNVQIDTGDGYIYSFSRCSMSKTFSDSPGMAYDPLDIPTSLRLTSVSAPNGRTVNFSYGSTVRLSSQVRYGSEVNGVYSNLSYDSNGEENYGVVPSQSGKKYTLIEETDLNLSSIRFLSPEGLAEPSFIYFRYEGHTTQNESDPSYFDNPYAPYLGPVEALQLLKEMTVYNEAGATIEKAELLQTAASSGTPKFFLSSVTTRRGGTWYFNYNLDGFSLPANDTQNTDHWGYWNGASITDLREHLRAPGSYVIQAGHYEMAPDSTEVYIPPVYGHVQVSHLYDQMEDSSKEANPNYAKCGALTRISYPTGGHTVIEYEGNSVTRRMNAYFPSDAPSLEYVDSVDHSVSYPVGGVRVSSLCDTDAVGHDYRTVFTYNAPDGNGSGLLIHMPKYVEDATYGHYAQNAGGLISCHALINIRAFSNPSSIQWSRDAHVAYPCVRVTHPDGSYTVHTFTSDADNYTSDIRSRNSHVVKRVISLLDWIEPYEANPYMETFITLDRSTLRGKPATEITYDSAGNEIHRTATAYERDTISFSEICHNGKYYYPLTGFSIEAPRVSSYTETLHGVSHSTITSYNARGQVAEKLLVAGSGETADTTKICYSYLWERDSTAFPAAVDTAVRSRIRNGNDIIVAAESYTYDDYPLTGNTKPTRIRLYESTTDGSFRDRDFSYDGAFRLSSASLPGGAHTGYIWNGHNLISRTDNYYSVTSYSWRDLVGPTVVEEPSGQTTYYEYDSAGRLTGISDTAANAVVNYQYKVKNE